MKLDDKPTTTVKTTAHSIVMTSSHLHGPDYFDKLMTAMLDIPVCEFIKLINSVVYILLRVDNLLIVVINCMTVALMIFLIWFYHYHTNWVKGRNGTEMGRCRERVNDNSNSRELITYNQIHML